MLFINQPVRYMMWVLTEIPFLFWCESNDTLARVAVENDDSASILFLNTGISMSVVPLPVFGAENTAPAFAMFARALSDPSMVLR